MGSDKRDELDAARAGQASAVTEIAQLTRELESVRATFARASLEHADELLAVLAERDTAQRELGEARDQIAYLQRELEHNAAEYAELATAYHEVAEVARTGLYALDRVVAAGDETREKVMRALAVPVPPEDDDAGDVAAPAADAPTMPADAPETTERWVEPFDEPAQ